MRLSLVICCCAFALIASCKKDATRKPYTYINVRFVEHDEYIFMETVEGNWDINTKVANLTGVGYQFQRFLLYLPNLRDTGFFPNPTISNFSYNDGFDFMPFKVTGGFIRITQLDSVSVSGHFQITMQDDFNGAEIRTVIGEFGINKQ